MSHGIWRWLECGKFCESGKWSCFCCVWSSYEGTNSNQWLPFQCKLYMNIKDVYFGKSDFFLGKNYVHVKRAFVLTCEHSRIFREIFAYMWLAICDYLHTLNARWLAYSSLDILAWEFLEVLNRWVVSI